MHAVPSFNRQRGDSVVNVFKVLSGMDITEKRKALDGSFSASVDGRKVDFRVATAGSVNGQKMVIRILDASRQVTTLTSLGMRPTMREKLEEVCQQSFGMMITCGPTGSGKTSTLYACLSEIDRFQRNVITLENPVEYQMDNITQIEVNPKAGKTFATELRSVLRQDPDVILIGEIRDAETAEIACQASQTGHMVFSTLHANDAVTSIGRLIDLGVKPFMIATSLSCVLGQRLVRSLCPKCKIAYNPNEETLKKLKVRAPSDRKLTFYKACEAKEGAAKEDICEKCKGSGYIGRSGVFELLVITEEIREMIRANLDLVALKQAASKSGAFVNLFEDGLRKVVEGKTSLEEVQRVAK
jgi:general secretion pathway protein E